MHFALIKNGVVDNIIVADPAFIAELQVHQPAQWEHMEPVTDACAIGWIWSGLRVVPPASEQDHALSQKAL